jgi:GNAT superfamily N-acetyltransferase
MTHPRQESVQRYCQGDNGVRESAVVRRIARHDLPALERHFLALGAKDRRLRFGAPFSDQAVASYVADVDLDEDAVFGCVDERQQLVGVAHLARRSSLAELGLSVLNGWRGRGIGQALFWRAHTHARNAEMAVLYMHCLVENTPMMHVARKQGLQIVRDAGEADALLRLSPPDAASHLEEALAEGLVWLDLALKVHWHAVLRAAGTFIGSRVPSTS